jgi:RES domain-containing protein
MIIYRIARTKFCDDSGEGAKKYGGRWNFPGYAALYASSSVSSGLLERLTIDPELFSAERYVLYSVMEIHCPDQLIVRLGPRKLPAGWDAIPFSKVSQDFGTHLLGKGVLCFAVPSVVDRTSVNYVLNPTAKGYEKMIKNVYPLKIGPRIVV